MVSGTQAENSTSNPLTKPSDDTNPAQVDAPLEVKEVQMDELDRMDDDDKVGVDCVPDTPTIKTFIQSAADDLSGSMSPKSPTRSHNLSAKTV